MLRVTEVTPAAVLRLNTVVVAGTPVPVTGIPTRMSSRFAVLAIVFTTALPVAPPKNAEPSELVPSAKDTVKVGYSDCKLRSFKSCTLLPASPSNTLSTVFAAVAPVPIAM